MNYDSCEHEYMELKSQFHQERMREQKEANDKGYLLVDDNQVEEPVGFRSVDGAVDYASDQWVTHDFTIYQLKKVLWWHLNQL